MKMENNIAPAVTVNPASGVARNPQDSPPTRIYKRDGAQNLGDVRAEIGKKRLDAAKNLEMIHDRLKEISQSLNQEMKIRSKNLKFSVDDVTNRMLVTVLDKESGKIVRQIPSDAILKVAHNLEALKGILFDDKY